MTGGKHLHAWLVLNMAPGLGPVTCRKLVAHFGSADKVLTAGSTGLKAAGTMRRETLSALCGNGRQELEKLAAAEITRAAENKTAIIACDDPRYPPLLKNIHDPPVVLYVKGEIDALRNRSIGIVGSRAATHYGKEVSGQIAGSLAGQGFTIVSGMALGIDTAAHRGALAAGGRTIAVLGCGLDIVYPPENHGLHEQIVSAGAVVSEYPFGTKPDSFRFPARNRIISGLSLGIVVVEATLRSGSLITASHALEQGREVFAVPGRIDSVKSAGTHVLLQQGAKLVHSVNDIVGELPGTECRRTDGDSLGTVTEHELFETLSQEEAKLFSFLDVYPRTIDEIVRECGFTPQKTSELLLMLELKGMIKTLPGKCYQRNSALTL